MSGDITKKKICLIVGEASGDVLGVRLMHALKQEQGGDVSFCGIGGPQMEREGLESLFPMSELSVMGIVEILPRLPKLLARIEQTAAFIEKEKPDLVVTIDSPDFCFRVAKKVRERCKDGPKMVHYVAPTVWAWRPERAAKVAALYDGIICLFPFEPPFFDAEGMRAVFAGHSALESYAESKDNADLRQTFGIPADAPVLGLLFGSRMGELNRIGPVLRGAALRIVQEQPGIHILSPTLTHLEREVKNLLADFPCPVHVISDPVLKWPAFAAMDRALATSGTVGLELAIADVPHLIAYKTGTLTAAIVKRKVRVKYAHLANILLDGPLVPEFIQEKCRSAAVSQAYQTLDIDKQKEGFDRVRAMLSPADGVEPSTRAATFLGDFLKGRQE